MPRPAPGSHARVELSLLAYVSGQWRSFGDLYTHLRPHIGFKKDVTARRAVYRHLDSLEAAGVKLEKNPDPADTRRVLYRGPDWSTLYDLFLELPAPRRRRTR